MELPHKSKPTFFWYFAFWFQHLRFSNHHFGKKRGAKGITTKDLPNEYMAGLRRPDWQGTKRIKNHPHHASKYQVWKHCELHCFFLSCSDNKLTRSTFSVTPSGGILLPSKAEDLLMSPEQKVQCSFTQALQEHGQQYGGAPADKCTCWYHVIKMDRYKTTSFLSPSCQLVAADVHSYNMRSPETFSKYTRKLLNPCRLTHKQQQFTKPN